MTNLRAAAMHCQLAAWSFTDEQAAEGLAVADRLRDIFLPPPAAASSAMQQPSTLLQLLPTELLSDVLSHLGTYDLARLAATCRPLWRDAPTPPPRPMPLLRPMGPVETELRRRLTARGLRICSSLPKGALSWVPYLLKRALCDALGREAPLAVGGRVSLFVDAEGRLLTCGTEKTGGAGQLLLGHDVDPDADPDEPSPIGPPTLVPSMQGRRIMSVAASEGHCLALSREGEVYSWGEGRDGSLGRAGTMAVPCRIESLNRIEIIVAGSGLTSAAVDEDGRLFTWGWARSLLNETLPNGLGYALDSHTEFQPTPKRVDALSEDRVVGVALGYSFTLAVTDAGAVFSFGHAPFRALGHGSVEAEVLPRRIEALAQTGRRFTAVAAGSFHALALTEAGELYGWGRHGWDELTPHQLTALVGQRVKLVCASDDVSCAVTEKGELFTWGNGRRGQLGHGYEEHQNTPKRVEGLSLVKVAATTMCTLTHSWLMRTASCGPSANALPSASVIRTRRPRTLYGTPPRSPLCACAPASPQTCRRSVGEVFRATRGDAVGHGCEVTCSLSRMPRPAGHRDYEHQAWRRVLFWPAVGVGIGKRAGHGCEVTCSLSGRIDMVVTSQLRWCRVQQ